MKDGPIIKAGEDPAAAVRRYAVQAADETDRFAIQLADTEWLLIPAFDIEWTLEDGDVIDVCLEVPALKQQLSEKEQLS